MMIAFRSHSSFSMHSFTIRRATRFVDATRGITAIDSIVVSRSTMRRVSMSQGRGMRDEGRGKTAGTRDEGRGGKKTGMRIGAKREGSSIKAKSRHIIVSL